jgi:hypothetical protein
MIKTLTAEAPEDLDKQVNEFEKRCVYPTGVTRVFATQTHVTQREGYKDPLFVAVIFYKGDEI